MFGELKELTEQERTLAPSKVDYKNETFDNIVVYKDGSVDFQRGGYTVVDNKWKFIPSYNIHFNSGEWDVKQLFFNISHT